MSLWITIKHNDEEEKLYPHLLSTLFAGYYIYRHLTLIRAICDSHDFTDSVYELKLDSDKSQLNPQTQQYVSNNDTIIYWIAVLVIDVHFSLVLYSLLTVLFKICSKNKLIWLCAKPRRRIAPCASACLQGMTLKIALQKSISITLQLYICVSLCV